MVSFGDAAPVRGLLGSLNNSFASWSLEASSDGAAKPNVDNDSRSKAIKALMLFSFCIGQGAQHRFAA